MAIMSFYMLLDKLKDGSKRQTIRKPRKIPLKLKDVLYMYWKLRTPETTILGIARITHIETKSFYELTLRDAKLDGFDTLDELREALVKIYGPHYCCLRDLDYRVITFEWISKGWT